MRVAKLLVQLFAAVLAAIAPGILDTGMDLTQWINVAILGIGGYQVWNAQNTNVWPAGKMLASAAMSVLVLLVSFIDGGVDVGEIAQLVIAALTPFGVFAARNSGVPNEPIART